MLSDVDVGSGTQTAFRWFSSFFWPKWSMLTVDVLKLKHLATTRSGPAMTERDVVSQKHLQQQDIQWGQDGNMNLEFRHHFGRDVDDNHWR